MDVILNYVVRTTIAPNGIHYAGEIFLIHTLKFHMQDVNGMNVTHPRLNVTEMRVSGVYMTYVNWSQSIVLGFIPAVMLIYFNTKIYLDIR